MKKLLLHSCCAPCSTAVIERLMGEYDITILYYNPNIYPKEEYEHRKAEEVRYLNILRQEKIADIKLLDCDYESKLFFEKVKGLENEREGGARCAVCFRLRLTKTAEMALSGGFDIFGTTLTVSPHKNAELINAIGQDISSRLGIEYLVSNFKKQNGYKRSVELAKENGLYRQKYCGCKFGLEQQMREAPDSLN